MHNIYVPEKDWTDARFQKLCKLCNQIIAYTNDLYGYEKELFEQNGDLSKIFINLVAYYEINDKCTLYEAMLKTRKVIVDMEEEISQLSDVFLADTTVAEDSKVFIKCLHDMIGANYINSITLSRYNNIY